MMGDIMLRTPTTGYGCCVWDSDPRWTMLKTREVLESTRISELSQIQAQDTSFDSVTESFPMAAILEIGERGNNNSSTPSKIDNSKKMYQAYKGQLKLSISVTNGYLSVHVQDARHLTTKSGVVCCSYVEVDMIPKISRRTQCRTATVANSSHPVFDERFTYELLGRDYQRRILVSVYHVNYSANSTAKELIGSMSFGIRNLAEKNTKVEGYYFLLADKIGQQKHMKVHTDETPMTKTSKTPAKSSQFRSTVPTPGQMSRMSNTLSTKISAAPPVISTCQKRAFCATPNSHLTRNQHRSSQGQIKRSRKCSQGSSSCSSSASGSDVDSVASDDHKMMVSEHPQVAHLSLPMYCGPSEQSYGLHLAQGCPTVISRVEAGSPADRAGLQEGDRVVAINGQDVQEMYPDSVAAVIRYYPRSTLVDIIRDVRRSSSRRVMGLDTVIPVSDNYDNDDFFEVTETYKQLRSSAREHGVIGRREQALSQLSTPVAKRDIVPLVKLSSKKKFFKLF